MTAQVTLSAAKVVSTEFANDWNEYFDTFIEMRVLGVEGRLAFILAFDLIANEIDTSNAAELAVAAECNPYFRENFERVLNATPIEKMWSEKKAVNHFLKIIQTSNEKGSNKIAALKELNVLCGITEIDDAGRSKKVPTLADLYGDSAANEKGENRPLLN